MYPMARRPQFVLHALLTAGLTLCVPGCFEPMSEGSFDSDNPAALLYATRRAGETRDRRAIPSLIDLLDHDDPAVRLMSINALERITGERKAYDYKASIIERQPAIERWRQAMRDGEFDHPAEGEH